MKRSKILAVQPPFTNPALTTRFDLANRRYSRKSSVVICRNADKFGGLLNMHGGHPMVVNGVRIRTVEALYQCCRYPKLPEVQQRIIDYPSPMIAKHYSLQFRDQGRANWYQVKVLVMEWCLHVKLACNYDTFGALLDATGKRAIVETSPDGNFWGGVPEVRGDETSALAGANMFGQLLVSLRDEYRMKTKQELLVVEPLNLPDFLLLGQPIQRVGPGGVA
jgi:ribA/ribD-fused uncharacterized protein